MKKTLAKEANHDFTNGTFKIADANDNIIYHENSKGFWIETEFNENNKEISYKDSNGYYIKNEYDEVTRVHNIASNIDF